MADLLTVYDDDQANTFIDCMICDKRIRGDTHYKIHVTTLQHLKKEDALVAQGQIPRQPSLPKWTDIRQYLEYLNLDEPIIGLSSLMQMPDHVADDGKSVLKYKCRMCFVEMDLYSIVAHIVGRKHRQKYLELKRPDLVTWNDSAQKQPGLVARAKAAVVEKQEGWGTPVPLKKTPVLQGSDFRSSAQQQQQQQQKQQQKQQPYHGRDFRRTEDMHKPKYLNEERQGRPLYTGDKYDRQNPGGSMGHQSYSEENRHQRQYVDADAGGRLLRGDQAGRRLREDYEESLGRGQFSRGDRIVSVDSGSLPKNRFNDKDLRIHLPGASEYQKEKMEGSPYAAYEHRKASANPVSMHGRSSYEEERRGTVRELSRTWDKANEMQGYSHMLEPRDPRAYSHEDIPSKKKRKSRFSDATAEEIAFAHLRHSNDNPRGTPGRAKPPLFNNQFGDSGSSSHRNSKEDNVLDIFNNIEIENMDDARFLKEKLCTVLKEFQATKAARVGGRNSQSPNDHRGLKPTDQRRDAYDDLRDDPDGMYLQNRSFQESRQYEDEPRVTRRYGGDYQESKRFDSYPSDLQEARPYSDEPRGFQKTRPQEQNLPERRRYDNDVREKEQRYEEYSRPDPPRSAQEKYYERYHEDDYRGNLDSERNWEQRKGRPFERFDDRERFGKSSFQPTSLQDDARMYVGRAQQRSHQNERQTGEELYDPFNPSSSPPPEASSSTSLDKIASTLLELVARR